MNSTSRAICIIPARGGSRRIPRKNIKNFLGKPIIAYSIEAAQNSGLFDEIMVSTDDEEIAAIAEEYSAVVPFKRSTKNSDDYATTLDVITEVLEQYENAGEKFDIVCCIYPCAPFVTDAKLIEAFDLLKEKDFDSVFPVVNFSFPIQRSLQIENDKVSFVHPEYAQARSQDLEKRFHDAGQFYLMKYEKTISNQRIITENSGAIIISELEGQDIDSETDWQLAELKYKLKNEIK